MFIPVAGSAEEAEDTAESVTLETCLSGLRYLLAKEAGCKKPREFESHRLRQGNTTKNGGVDEWFKSTVY